MYNRYPGVSELRDGQGFPREFFSNLKSSSSSPDGSPPGAAP